jgi:AcrR family transcriptional regulator
MATASPERLRRDARDNRQAIIDAARELFADSIEVPMSQVAKRAGVGQATLYRNFPSRGALAAEILDEQVERIAALAADHAGEPDAFFILLRALVDGMVYLYGFAALARADETTDAHLQLARRRIAELLKDPLCDAKAAGTLRRDISTDDIFLLLAMGRGAMADLPDSAARSAVAHRVQSILLRGIEQGGE